MIDHCCSHFFEKMKDISWIWLWIFAKERNILKRLEIKSIFYLNLKVVYLLGRSGNQLGALDLMVNKLLRIDMAIDFCAENDDPELWERLIESAIKRPEQCAILLKRMASIKINSFDVILKVKLIKRNLIKNIINYRFHYKWIFLICDNVFYKCYVIMNSKGIF